MIESILTFVSVIAVCALGCWWMDGRPARNGLSADSPEDLLNLSASGAMSLTSELPDSSCTDADPSTDHCGADH